MTAIRILQSKQFYRARLITSSVLAIAWCSGVVAQTANVPPPSKYVLDENGVNLATGAIVMPRVDVSIGPKDDPLQLVNFGGVQLYSNLQLNLFVAGGYSPTVSAMVMGANGPTSKTFTVSGTTYTSKEADGSTLSLSGSVYTLILDDGTQYVYGNTDLTTYDYIIGNGLSARITEIKMPSGQTINFNYKKVTYTCPNSYCPISGGSQETKVRLQTVSRSDGYQIHLNYVSNLTSTGQQQSDWSVVQTAVAFNKANEYCDPVQDVCSLTQQWPTASYQTALVNGISVTSVTTAEGTHKYWSAYDSTGSYSYYQRPGAATYSEVMFSSNATARISSITNNGVTRQYNFNLVQSGIYPIIYTMNATKTNPDGSTRIVVTDQAVGTPSSITDESGGIYSFVYDSNGRLTQATSPEGRYTGYTYDSRGNITAVTNVTKPGSGLANIVTTAGYDATCANAFTCNQPNWTRDALGNQTDYTYNSAHGGVLTVTAPADVSGVRPQTRYSYTQLQAYFKNSAGSIVASGVPTYRSTATSSCLSATSANPASCVGTGAESKTTVSFGLQMAGTGNNLLPVSETLASGDGSLSATTGSTYDKVGNQTAQDGQLAGTADTTVYRYDAARRLVGVVNPDPDGAGIRTPTGQRLTYNPDNQVTLSETGTVTDQSDTAWTNFSSQQQVANTYDTNAHLVQTKVTAGGSTHSLTQQSYDTTGRVKCRVQRMDPAQWSSQSDACVPQTTSTNGPDRVTQTAYDGLNRVTTTTVGVGTADTAIAQTSTYTADGQLATAKDADSNLTTYEYDGFDRATKTRFPVSTAGASASSTTDYEQNTYDADSRVTQRRLRDGGTITFAYDNLNRVTTRTGSVDGASSFQYDLAGNNTQMSGPSLTTTMAYDSLGRLLNEVQPFGSGSYQYDNAGRLTRLTWADGFYVTYDFDVAGNVTAIRENGAASGIGVLATYTYDNLGRRTGIVRGNGTSTSYAFDPVSRLTATTQDLAGTASDQTIGSMTYNPASQIQSQVKSNDAYAWTGHYNVNRNYTVNGLNQQTAAGATALGYDARGNLVTSGTSTYTYDQLNELTSAPGVALAYDPAGRLQKYNTGSPTVYNRFTYAGSALIQESVLPSGAITRRYVPGPGTDEPVVWYEGSSTTDRRWLHADERGSVIAISDGSGAMLNINRYDEYGIPQSTNAGRFQYTGQSWLPELGMYYYKARMYSPTLGRFMQTDPIGYGDGMNWYNYVHADPVNGTDSTGLEEGGGQVTIFSGDIVVTAARLKPIAFGNTAFSGSGMAGGGTGSESLNLGAAITPFAAQATVLAANATDRGRTGKATGTKNPDKKFKPGKNPGEKIYTDPHTGKSTVKPWPEDPRLNGTDSENSTSTVQKVLVVGGVALIVAGLIFAPEVTIPTLIVAKASQ